MLIKFIPQVNTGLRDSKEETIKVQQLVITLDIWDKYDPIFHSTDSDSDLSLSLFISMISSSGWAGEAGESWLEDDTRGGAGDTLGLGLSSLSLLSLLSLSPWAGGGGARRGSEQRRRAWLRQRGSGVPEARRHWADTSARVIWNAITLIISLITIIIIYEGMSRSMRANYIPRWWDER